jgi:hypothetical protein
LALLNSACELEPVFAIVPAMFFANHPIGIQKNPQYIGEVKAALRLTGFAFNFVSALTEEV